LRAVFTDEDGAVDHISMTLVKVSEDVPGRQECQVTLSL
jgi:hypothetical protein